jgi:hypothetical protein
MKKKMDGAAYEWPSDEPFLGKTGLNVHIDNPGSVTEVMRALTGENNKSV